MKTDTEKAMLRDLENQLHSFDVDVELPEEIVEVLGDFATIKSLVIGSALSILDILFAIRDGEEWRGESDPQKMATEMLRGMGFKGEETSNNT